jgi:hypothetical protein
MTKAVDASRRRDSQRSQIEARAKQTAKAIRASAHGRFEK